MSSAKPAVDANARPTLSRFVTAALAIFVAILITGWLIQTGPNVAPANDQAAEIVQEDKIEFAPEFSSGASGTAGTGRSEIRAATLRNPLSVEDRYIRSTDLYAYYEEMLALGQAGDAEATYHAALALHECGLADTRTNGWSCGTQGDPSEHVVRLCTEMRTRCEGFADMSADKLNRLRESLYEEAAETGYERGIARQLIDLSESDPDLAMSMTRDLLASTQDFGTLFHIGRYLQNRLWRNHEGWIGGEWNEDAGRPSASARWGQAAWQLAACDYNQGCTGDSVFMRSLCVSGNGCEPGWSYQDWLAYYRSPYELEQINGLSETMRDALLNGDTDTIIDQGAEGPDSN